MTTRKQSQDAETKRSRMIAEADRLEDEVAALRRSLITRGELREALTAVEQRLTAWWEGGDREQACWVIADTLGWTIDELPPALVEDPGAVVREVLQGIRTQMLSSFAPDAEDYPIPRRPEVVAAETERCWGMLLRGLAGDGDN
jgi:hypothetical protein